MTTTHQSPSALTLDRLGPSFGAEVIGLDLRALDDEQVAAVRAALVDHKVLFFRGQDLTDADQVDLGRRLGELTAGHPVASSADGRAPGDLRHRQRRPGVLLLRRLAHRRDVHGATAARLDPARRAAPGVRRRHELGRQPARLRVAVRAGPAARRRAHRRARRQPRVGRLPAPPRRAGQRLGRRAGHRAPPRSSTRSSASTPRPAARGCSSTPASPRTSSASPTPRAAAILDLLYAHLTKPEHTIRHRWPAGDVGIWDNRSTSHYANRDYTETRVMRRITLQGDRPRGPAAAKGGPVMTILQATTVRPRHAALSTSPSRDATDHAARQRREAARGRRPDRPPAAAPRPDGCAPTRPLVRRGRPLVRLSRRGAREHSAGVTRGGKTHLASARIAAHPTSDINRAAMSRPGTTRPVSPPGPVGDDVRVSLACVARGGPAPGPPGGTSGAVPFAGPLTAGT